MKLCGNVLAQFFVRLFPGGSCVSSSKIDRKLKSILKKWTEIHVEENRNSGIKGVEKAVNPTEFVCTHVPDNDSIHPGNLRFLNAYLVYYDMMRFKKILSSSYLFYRPDEKRVGSSFVEISLSEFRQKGEQFFAEGRR